MHNHVELVSRSLHVFLVSSCFTGCSFQHDTYVSPTLTYDHRENPRDIWSYAWAGRRVLQKQYMGAGAPEGDITQHPARDAPFLRCIGAFAQTFEIIEALVSSST